MHENPHVHEKTKFFVWPSWMSEVGYMPYGLPTKNVAHPCARRI